MIDVVITSLCLQFTNLPESSKYYTSCINATQAASIQYHVKPVVDSLEQDVNNRIKAQTGEAIWWVVGVGFAYQQHGDLQFNFGARPIIDNIGLRGNKDSTHIDLSWSW